MTANRQLLRLSETVTTFTVGTFRKRKSNQKPCRREVKNQLHRLRECSIHAVRQLFMGNPNTVDVLKRLYVQTIRRKLSCLSSISSTPTSRGYRQMQAW